MAANEERSALWRTPLSTPVRTNENGFQNVFRHSEKLLASAVSICRLKGSIECQTGGLITVCEEMQRLLRLAFSETARLEKELKRQKLTYDEDLSLLEERLSYLEEMRVIPKPKDIATKNTSERLPLKPSNNDNIIQDEDVVNRQVDKSAEKTPKNKVHTRKVVEMKSPDCNIACGNFDDLNQNVHESKSPKESCEIVQEQEPEDQDEHGLPDSESEDLSLEVSVFDSPPTACKTKAKSRKTSSKKLEESSSAKSIKTPARKVQAKPKSANTKGKQPKSTESKTKRCRSSTKACEEKKSNSDVELDDNTFDANDSVSSDVYLNPESGLLEIIECTEIEVEQVEENDPRKNVTKQRREKKIKNGSELSKKKDQIKQKNENKNDSKQKKNKEPDCTKMSKEADVGYLSLPESPKRGPSKSQRKSIPESPVRNAAGNMKNEETTAEMNVSLSKTKPQVTVNEQDEMLGDMSFLIDISSMISSFMSDPVPQQLELPLMQARERADARKLATLFNLHISIGNKMESRSSLILSKTSNSRMPKPGKLDNLLSKLSIAAAKEAERLSSKARTKRKLSAIADDAPFNDKDDSQSRKNTKSLSRCKKARI